MSDLEREILLGYMLGALEEHESQEVCDELQRNATLRAKLANVQNEVKPIHEYAQRSRHVFHPPQGLAKRIARNIWEMVDSQAVRELHEQHELPVPERTPPLVSSGPAYQKQTRPRVAAVVEQAFLPEPSPRPSSEQPLQDSQFSQNSFQPAYEADDKSLTEKNNSNNNSNENPFPFNSDTYTDTDSFNTNPTQNFNINRTRKDKIQSDNTNNPNEETDFENKANAKSKRKYAVQGRISYRTLLKITSLSRSERKSSSKMRRFFDILTSVSVCAMLVVVSLTAIQYIKDHVKKIYYAKALQNLGLDEAMLSSHYGNDSTHMIGSHGDGSFWHNRNPRTDLGSVLTSFTELNQSRGSLEMIMPYENVKNSNAATFQLTSSNLGVSNPYTASVPITYTSASSFPNFEQVLPFLHLKRNVDQHNDLRSNKSSEILLDQQGLSQTPTLLIAPGGTPMGTLYKVEEGTNVFYRDDRIFIKKFSP